MIDLIGKILCSAIKNLFTDQPDIFKFSSETGETEWNLAHHISNEVYKYIFWLDNDVDLTKRHHGHRRPDLVFHKRGTNTLNFLVAELKHRGADNADDIKKIMEDWMKNNLDYRFGASIRIINEHKYRVIIFANESNKIFDQTTSYIPIKQISPDDRKLFVNKVDEIYATAMNNDYHQDKTKQDKVKGYQQLDEMVRGLYGCHNGKRSC